MPSKTNPTTQTKPENFLLRLNVCRYADDGRSRTAFDIACTIEPHLASSMGFMVCRCTRCSAFCVSCVDCDTSYPSPCLLLVTYTHCHINMLSKKPTAEGHSTHKCTSALDKTVYTKTRHQPTVQLTVLLNPADGYCFQDLAVCNVHRWLLAVKHEHQKRQLNHGACPYQQLTHGAAVFLERPVRHAANAAPDA